MKRLFNFSALSISLLLAGSALAAQERPRAPLSEDVVEDASVGLLQEAAAIFAGIEIILAEGRYELTPAEYQRILDLGLEGELEKPVVQAAWQIVEKLRAAHRYSIAHDVLNRALAHTVEPESCFNLNILKAKTYEEQKLFRQAFASVHAADQCRASRPQQ